MDTEKPARAGRRERLGLGVLALVLLRPGSPTGPHEEEGERPRTPDESEAADGSIPVNGPATVRTVPNHTAEEG